MQLIYWFIDFPVTSGFCVLLFYWFTDFSGFSGFCVQLIYWFIDFSGFCVQSNEWINQSIEPENVGIWIFRVSVVNLSAWWCLLWSFSFLKSTWYRSQGQTFFSRPGLHVVTIAQPTFVFLSLFLQWQPSTPKNNPYASKKKKNRGTSQKE